MRVITLLNETHGSRFIRYRCGDTLVEGPTLDLPGELVEGNDFAGLLDAAWAIGNRQGEDLDGQSWPSTVRSLSVADVVGVEVAPSVWWWWTVEDLGFRTLLMDPRVKTPGGVHVHGPEEGPGVGCPEYLVGACRLVPAVIWTSDLRSAVEACAKLPCIRMFWGSRRPCADLGEETCAPCQARAALARRA